MTKKTFLLVVLALMFSCTSCDNTYMDGTWKCHEVDGDYNPMKFVISGINLEVYQTVDGNEVLAYIGTVTYNNLTCPKQMDITITDTLFPEYIGKTSLGIYKIEDNKFILCNEEPGNGLRPETFTSEGNPRLFILTKE